MLEEFGNVIARGGYGVVIASQSGHRLPPLSAGQNRALATTLVEELLHLPMLQPGQKRGARVNTISPGIIFTPLAKDELTGPRRGVYHR